MKNTFKVTFEPDRYYKDRFAYPPHSFLITASNESMAVGRGWKELKKTTDITRYVMKEVKELTILDEDD